MLSHSTIRYALDSIHTALVCITTNQYNSVHIAAHTQQQQQHNSIYVYCISVYTSVGLAVKCKHIMHSIQAQCVSDVMCGVTGIIHVAMLTL
jgi:hypothetical protein